MKKIVGFSLCWLLVIVILASPETKLLSSVQSRIVPRVNMQRFTASEVQCGRACLQFLVKRLGWQCQYRQVPEPFCLDPSGWSLRQLSDSAEAMGWISCGMVDDWDSIKRLVCQQQHAAILHVDRNHFLLVFGGSHDEVQLFDPATNEVVAVESLPRRYEWDGVTLAVRCSG